MNGWNLRIHYTPGIWENPLFGGKRQGGFLFARFSSWWLINWFIFFFEKWLPKSLVQYNLYWQFTEFMPPKIQLCNLPPIYHFLIVTCTYRSHWKEAMAFAPGRDREQSFSNHMFFAGSMLLPVSALFPILLFIQKTPFPSHHVLTSQLFVSLKEKGAFA